MMAKINQNITFQRLLFLPPTPGTCPICAACHAPDEPHCISSLYYLLKFRQAHGRFPTAEDASAHCPCKTQTEATVDETPE